MSDFTVLLLNGAYASGVAVTLDILAAAKWLAARAGATAPSWQVCSVFGGDVTLSSGLRIATARLTPRRRKTGALWVIPGIGVDRLAKVDARLLDEDMEVAARAVARHVRAGGRVAASCSAVFLLHKAGVLAGRRATTAWWLAPHLQQRATDSAVDANRMVCADGPVLTSGAALAQVDLMLHLLRDHSGSKLSGLVSRMLLIDGRQAQAPFIVPELLASGDQLVGQVVARIEAAFPETVSVEELAAAFGMSARTLSRHVRRATGNSTMALVQSVKLRKARGMIESSRMNIEQIAASVGYQDSTALRRMMRKVTGSNPSSYRQATSIA